jgi:hypothetical protein
MIDICGGRLVGENTDREQDAMVEALEHVALMRHIEMLVGNACPQQPPAWLW